MAHTDRRCCSPAGHRAVALLDVDHTTLFGIVGFDDASLQLNDVMLQALKDRGVRDAFFFTDMTLSTSSVGERQALATILRERYALEVHGVLTPCDIAWGGVDAAEAVRLHELCFGAESAYAGPVFGEPFAAFLRARRGALPKLAEAVRAYDPARNVAGAAFRAVTTDGAEGGVIARETTARSLFAKALGDHLAATLGYPHAKGLLLDLFLRRGAPAWMGSIVVCDDDAAVDASVREFAPVAAESLRADAPPLLRCPPALPLTMLRVTGRDMPAEAYAEAFDGHFRKVHEVYGVPFVPPPPPPPKCAVS
jgi:hypothetical protein